MSSVKIEKYIYAEKGAKDGLSKSILETLVKVHAKAVALCPVRQINGGQLKNSLMIVTSEGDEFFNTSGESEKAPANHKITLRAGESFGYVGTNSDHWYPEFGTRFQVAQPFLRPAGEIAKGASAKETMAKYCRKEMLNEFAKRKMQIIIKEING